MKWKIIKDYENYQISNTGQVRNFKTKRVLKQNVRNGYYACSLCNKNGKKTKDIHRLVAYAFIKKIKGKPYVNHINGNKLDNCSNNLEWATQKENVKHARETGLMNTFKRKVIQYDKENNIINTFESIKEAGLKTGINAKHISDVCLGSRNTTGGYKWKYVNEQKYCKPKGKAIPNYDNYLITKDGNIFSKRSNKYLKLRNMSSGYLSIGLSKNGDKKDFYVHRLVAKTYIENPNEYKEVNHIDSNKQNNNIDNLEWCTSSKNMIHHVAQSKNLFKRKIIQLSMEGEIINQFNSIKDASTETRIDKSSIVRVCKNKQKHAGNYLWSYVI